MHCRRVNPGDACHLRPDKSIPVEGDDAVDHLLINEDVPVQSTPVESDSAVYHLLINEDVPVESIPVEGDDAVDGGW